MKATRSSSLAPLPVQVIAELPSNAFSKKFENHCHMVALYAVWYNFIRIHKTLRVTPAMEAGVTDRLFTYEELIGIVDEWEANQKDKESRSL